MRLIDATRTISPGMMIYPGDLPPMFVQEDRGDCRISDIRLCTHTGTHIDAPSHYLRTGGTIDAIPLSHLIGRCRVLDVRSAGSTITADHLRGHVGGIDRVLLKTTFSGVERFEEDYPCLTADAAGFIAANSIRCIGIDSPSVEPYNGNGAVHRTLLGHGCIIIELLDLSMVGAGEYDMAALPLRLAGLDGSPARVLLFSRGK